MNDGGLCASSAVYNDCRLNCGSVLKFIMIVGGIVCVFSSLY
jgi:hypothetical protein